MGHLVYSLSLLSLAVSAFATHHNAHQHHQHHRRDPGWAAWSDSDTSTSSSATSSSASSTADKAVTVTYSLVQPSAVATTTTKVGPTAHVVCKPESHSSASDGGSGWGMGPLSGLSGLGGNGLGISWPSDVPTFASNVLSPAQSSALFHPVVHQRPLTTSNILSGVGALAQHHTNGLSLLGTLHAPKLGPYRADGTTLENGSPWGPRTSKNSNPYKETPFTGNTRSYVFNVARGVIAPDGVEREVLLINDQFPGPTIEANWGDTISVTVTNSITGPEEGTSFHWHGLLQKESPYMDGVPGIQQCPIAPGSTFTYTFIADLYGTSWYHSHFSAQYAGGLVGAMIIHGPQNQAYDIDVGPVLLTDYYHAEYYDIVEAVMGTDLSKIAPRSDNNLINGKGNYDCSLTTGNSTSCTDNAGLARFEFTAGSVHRLRLINAGASGVQQFSIDNHVLQVIAYDFVEIVPYETTEVTLAVGQRADVLVKANGTSDGLYWMRSSMDNKCSHTHQPNAFGIVDYSGKSNGTSLPTSTAWPSLSDGCENDNLSRVTPYYALTPAAEPATTITMTIGAGVNSTGNLMWTINQSSFRVCYNDPIYFCANEGNTSYPYSPEWNVYDLGSNETVRVIVYNPTGAPHPMHIHGHNMYILASGIGSQWDGTVVNPENPTRRDVHLLPPRGYMVMQIDSDNPGVWPFHCHIAWHVSGGLYVNLLERPTMIQNVTIPSHVKDTCSTWTSWTNTGIVDQIDSGLKKRTRSKRWSEMIGSKVGSRKFGVRRE